MFFCSSYQLLQSLWWYIISNNIFAPKACLSFLHLLSFLKSVEAICSQHKYFGSKEEWTYSWRRCIWQSDGAWVRRVRSKTCWKDNQSGSMWWGHRSTCQTFLHWVQMSVRTRPSPKHYSVRRHLILFVISQFWSWSWWHAVFTVLFWLQVPKVYQPKRKLPCCMK